MLNTNALRKILLENNTVAIVGLSDKWHRPSYFVGKYLVDHGYKIIPVNPNHEQILGQQCYPDLASIPHPVDIVDLFQRADTTPDYALQAIEIGAKVLWLQLGIINQEAQKLAQDANLKFVMNKCLKIEHARIFGGLNFIGVDTKIISSSRIKVISN
ncbi:CoA-binding protein [Candidatus Spongiihabitans sp.]|uniref:CoA-binding protein n=1 Tax=Candidatus Spongiihabitans sp. TaxID=3101308 RepID=UPI003C6F1435